MALAFPELCPDSVSPIPNSATALPPSNGIIHASSSVDSSAEFIPSFRCKLRDKKNQKKAKDKLINIFASNVSSLSNHAKGYLFSPQSHSEYDVLMIAEAHNPQKEEVIRMFDQHRRKAHYNPPLKLATGGTHGGEIIAFHSDVNNMPIEDELLQQITRLSNRELAFVGAYLRVKHVTILMITVYLFDTEKCLIGIMN